MCFITISAFLVSVILFSHPLYSDYPWANPSNSFCFCKGFPHPGQPRVTCNMRLEMQISSACHHPKDLCIPHIYLLFLFGKFISWPTPQWFFARKGCTSKPKKKSPKKITLLFIGLFFFSDYNLPFPWLFRIIKPCLIFNSECTCRFCRASLWIIFLVKNILVYLLSCY